MIAFENVSFFYGSKTILRDVTFSVRAREKVAVLGGSGEGKTTVLRLMLGLVKPDAGKITVHGEDITAKTEKELRKVRHKFSIVFQEGALFDSLSVKENVAFCLREYTTMREEEIEEKVRAMLGRVNMEDAIDLMPEQLSGGMKRRVALMRSLAAFEPEMFLYDEPTAGLDSVNADIVLKLVMDLTAEGKGFIMVTHEVMSAVRVSERFLFLKEGRICFDGSGEELLALEAPEIQISVGQWQSCAELSKKG